MILSLFRKSKLFKGKPFGTVPAVYSAIVAQSRHPVFYRDWGVDDTMTGRFDMISLHMCLVFRRMRREGEDARAFSQALFDYFFQDMDRSLREAGVGDLSVGKRIGKMGELFYGLLSNLSEALESGDRALLKGVLSRNFFEGNAPDALDALADYVLDSTRRLQAQKAGAIRNGDLDFGAPQ